jgi:hypothetical protein
MIKVQFPAGVRNFSLLLNIQIDSGTHTTYYSIHTETVSVEVKRPEHEADQ